MTFHGIVVRGQGHAATYGYPTANIRMETAVTPGTWAARVRYKDATYQAAAYCSMQDEPLAELHLLDFNGNLYDQPLTVELLAHVSKPVPFENESQMARKIAQDVHAVSDYFKTDA